MVLLDLLAAGRPAAGSETTLRRTSATPEWNQSTSGHDQL
jgi:hypothetical protein